MAAGSWTFSNDIFINGIPLTQFLGVINDGICKHRKQTTHYMVNNYKGHYFLLSGLHWLPKLCPKFQCFLSGKWMAFSSLTIWHPFPWSCAYGYGKSSGSRCGFPFQVSTVDGVVSSNGGTPKHHQNDNCLVGKPMVVGYHHFRKPPYIIGKNHRSLFSRTKFHQISKRKLKGPKLASS